MRIIVTLDDQQMLALDKMMQEDLASNRTAFLVGLIGAEQKRRGEVKRGPGRPKKEEEEEWPDENAPKTLKIPKHLQEFVPIFDKDKKVNEYDLLMLEEKKKLHDHRGNE